MKCLNCNSIMEKVIVRIENARNKALSYQCGKCGYFDFEKNSIDKIIKELSMKD